MKHEKFLRMEDNILIYARPIYKNTNVKIESGVVRSLISTKSLRRRSEELYWYKSDFKPSKDEVIKVE